MAKCVVCTHLNSQAEHEKRSKSLDKKDEGGSVRKGFHGPTAATEKALRKRRTFYSPKTSPHKFCRVHSEFGTGRSTIAAFESDCRKLQAEDVARAAAAKTAEEESKLVEAVA